MHPLFLLLAAVATLAATRPAHAQAGWSADLSAGYVTYEAAAARIGTGSLIAGVRYLGAGAGWGYLYGGAPLESGVFWSALGAGRRVAAWVGPVQVGIDAGAHGVVYRDQASGLGGASATVEALPLVALQRGPVTAQLRSGLLQNSDFYADTTDTRRIHETGLNVVLALAPGVRAGADARWARAPEDDFPFLGGSVEVERGPVRAWGLAGRWLNDTLPTPAIGAGATWEVRQGWELTASWQQETNSPLFRNFPRRTWSVQLSHHFGRRAGPSLPVPAVATRDAAGEVVIRIPAGEAAPTPSVIGDFTDWQPVAMSLEEGFWTLRIALAPGVYRYGFHDPEGRWFLPPSITQRVDDGMGGASAVLIVQ